MKIKMKMRNDFLRRPPKPSLYALGVCATGQKQMGPPSCLDDQSWVCAGYAPTNEATTPGPKLEVWTTRTTNEAPPGHARTHTHTQTDRQTDRHTQTTHTHRDAETQRHRDTDSESEIPMRWGMRTETVFKLCNCMRRGMRPETVSTKIGFL